MTQLELDPVWLQVNQVGSNLHSLVSSFVTGDRSKVFPATGYKNFVNPTLQ